MSLDSHIPRTTPSINDPHRRAFERAYQSNNELFRASVVLDRTTAQAAPHIWDRVTNNTPLPHDALNSVAEGFTTAKNALKQAGDTPDSWQDYFRLKTQVDTIHMRPVIERSFAEYNREDVREKLVNGLSGVHVEILANALKQFDQVEALAARTDNPLLLGELGEERERLRGAISEQTLFALLNRYENPDSAAVVPMIVDDLYRKTDMTYYYVDHKTQTSHRVPVQLKTSRTKNDEQTRPDGGFTLHLRDYDHSPDQYLSRLLVAEYQPMDLSNTQQGYLKNTARLLHTNVAKHLAQTPGEVISAPIQREQIAQRVGRQAVK